MSRHIVRRLLLHRLTLLPRYVLNSERRGAGRPMHGIVSEPFGPSVHTDPLGEWCQPVQALPVACEKAISSDGPPLCRLLFKTREVLVASLRPRQRRLE